MRDFGEHEDRENEIELLHAALAFGNSDPDRMVLVEDPKHGSSEQEDQKQRENHDRAQGERFAAIGHGFAGEDSLDNELFGAVGGHDHDSTADHSHPDVEGRTERKFRVEPVKFAGRPRFAKDAADSTVEQRGNVTNGENASDQKQAELDRIGPNDGLDAANVGVNQRQGDEEKD